MIAQDVYLFIGFGSAVWLQFKRCGKPFVLGGTVSLEFERVRLAKTSVRIRYNVDINTIAN